MKCKYKKAGQMIGGWGKEGKRREEMKERKCTCTYLYVPKRYLVPTYYLLLIIIPICRYAEQGDETTTRRRINVYLNVRTRIPTTIRIL